jgi:hypothetical protein
MQQAVALLQCQAQQLQAFAGGTARCAAQSMAASNPEASDSEPEERASAACTCMSGGRSGWAAQRIQTFGAQRARLSGAFMN